MAADPSAWEAELGRYRLLFGAGAVDRVGELAREIGGTRLLVVTDAGVSRDTGHRRARAVESLRRTCAIVGVRLPRRRAENPTTETRTGPGRRNGRARALRRLPAGDLGGGSAMDCAKGINFLLTNGGRMEDYCGTGKATTADAALVGQCRRPQGRGVRPSPTR